MKDVRLTNNFLLSEFACKGFNCCGNSAPIHMELVLLLQAIRERVQMPVRVSSGFRCRTHNSRVAGASANSYHTRGMAADIFIDRPATARDLMTQAQAAVEELGYGFLLYYEAQNFVHVDIRNLDWR